MRLHPLLAWSRGTNGYTATWMDDPNMTGTPRRTENNAPYDFAGGTVSTANPFKTASVAEWVAHHYSCG